MAARSTFRRRRLGRRLKQARDHSGMTIEVAAPLLDKTRSSLGRIERGETAADVHLVRSMMDVYDHRDDELLQLARDAANKGWWHAYTSDDFGYLEVESEANAVCEYGGLNIPGLLQTEAFIRAQLRAGLRRTEQELENQVQVRLIRQRRLTDEENPLELTAIIDEAALAREIGGRDVMSGQLRHLVAMSKLPGVTVQLLPYRSGVHDAMAGAFIVLSFPYPDEPDLLFVSHPTGAQHIEEKAEVRAATLIFDRLRSQALPPKDSAAMIERLADDLYGSR